MKDYTTVVLYAVNGVHVLHVDRLTWLDVVPSTADGLSPLAYQHLGDPDSSSAQFASEEAAKAACTYVLAAVLDREPVIFDPNPPR